ncbi:hypothetical protein J6590_027370 [Homalodisca vitripennis]|nr:hypothetical protein J6590_027370 [Homalodisca vitripennis]
MPRIPGLQSLSRVSREVTSVDLRRQRSVAAKARTEPRQQSATLLSEDNGPAIINCCRIADWFYEAFGLILAGAGAAFLHLFHELVLQHGRLGIKTLSLLLSLLCWHRLSLTALDFVCDLRPPTVAVNQLALLVSLMRYHFVVSPIIVIEARRHSLAPPLTFRLAALTLYAICVHLQ